MSELGRTITAWDPVREIWLKWPEFLEGAVLDRSREGTVALSSVLDEQAKQHKSFLRVRIITATSEGDRSARVAMSAYNAVDVLAADTENFFNGREPILYWRAGRRGSVIAGLEIREPLFKDIQKIYRRDGLKIAPASISFERCAIETDGEGTALLTRENWLRRGWNPKFNVNQLHEALRADFGIEQVLWIDRGLPDDPTDGQVHRVARFIEPGKVLVMDPAGAPPAYQGVLKAVIQSLKGRVDAQGRALELFAVPAPRLVSSAATETIAASHLGYLQCNQTVVVPEYDLQSRTEVEEAFKVAFPHKDIRFIKAPVAMGLGGSLHAMSMIFPRFDRE